jgi:hypothetical protein
VVSLGDALSWGNLFEEKVSPHPFQNLSGQGYLTKKVQIL